mmetsp:Transcript_20340/g.52078  ORF Transcript_20340/g.52078 Transcript_20340/m.52078 type:complete len:132 (-) Transcript_20340:1340-1735(-)
MLGLQLADLIINWADTDRPVRALIILVITIIISLALGLLPIVDNYSHIGGFIVGVFSGFIFLKSTRFGHCQKFLVVLGSFLLLVYMTAGFFVFYQDIDTSGRRDEQLAQRCTHNVCALALTCIYVSGKSGD